MNVISLLGLLSSIFGGLGIAYAFFRVGKAKTIIDLLTEENAILTTKTARLEADAIKEKALHEAEIVTKNSAITYQLEQIQIFKELAQGTPELTKLTAEITNLAKEIAKLIKVTTKRAK